jgi:hypothetical protein
VPPSMQCIFHERNISHDRSRVAVILCVCNNIERTEDYVTKTGPRQGLSGWIPVSWPFRYGAFRGRAQQSPPRTQQLVAHNHSILLKRMASIRLGALSRELIALLSAAPSTTFWLGIVVAFSRDGFCSAWRRRGEARTTTRSSSNGASFLGSERSQRWRTSPTAFCESKALLEDRSATHP